MSSRIYNITVTLFWLATMAWLVVSKVVPALRKGDPPNHHEAAVVKLTDTAPVIWDMKWDLNHIGWAANKVAAMPDGRFEVLSRIQFTEWPDSGLQSLSLLLPLADLAGQGDGFHLRISNRSLLDADMQLQQLDSALSLNDPSEKIPWMRITGNVESQQLKLAFRLRDRNLGSKTIPIRPRSLVSNEISPRGFMPRLRLHQQWTTYQISPLRPPTSPQLPVVARVERYESMIWDNRVVETFLVVYRKDAGAGSQAADEYLGRMWVRPDNGMVLRQEMVVLGSHLNFIRRTPEAAKPLADMLERHWAASYDDWVGADELERKLESPAGP